MPRRSFHQREADLELINAWYLQGKSQRQIAEELGALRNELGYEVSHQTISNDLAELRKRWQVTARTTRDKHIAQELARIDRLEAEYWKQYFDSMGEIVTITEHERTVTPDDEKPPKPKASNQATESAAIPLDIQRDVTKRREFHTGNPAYMAGIERCIQLRVSLLGLNAPTKRTEVPWELQAVEDIRAGLLDYETLVDAFDDPALVDNLFAKAGVPVKVAGEKVDIQDDL